MSIDRLAQLKSPHLYGMATAWAELLAEGTRRPMQPEAWLDRLIDAKQADRQVRSLRYQMKAARFPIHRDLTGIDWAETPLPQAQISPWVELWLFLYAWRFSPSHSLFAAVAESAGCPQSTRLAGPPKWLGACLAH